MPQRVVFAEHDVVIVPVLLVEKERAVDGDRLGVNAFRQPASTPARTQLGDEMLVLLGEMLPCVVERCASSSTPTCAPRRAAASSAPRTGPCSV